MLRHISRLPLLQRKARCRLMRNTVLTGISSVRKKEDFWANIGKAAGEAGSRRDIATTAERNRLSEGTVIALGGVI